MPQYDLTSAPVSLRGILNFPENDPSAADEYSRGRNRSAWYFEHRRGARSVVSGVRTKANLIFYVNGGAIVLPEHSMLMRTENGAVFAVFPQELADSYSRCFADGTALCRLSDGELEQALALNTANLDLREVTTALEKTPLIKTLFKGKEVRRSLKKAKERANDITAHIQDLARNAPVVRAAAD